MRVEEIKKYKEDEFQIPLWIRVEAVRVGDAISIHNNLSIDK